jgi:flotillin
VLKLSANQSIIEVSAVDSQKIPIGVRGSVVFKVGDDDEAITNAARRFLGEQEDMRGIVSEMEKLVTNVLHGHLRSILGGITVEDLIANRNELASTSREAVKDEMDRLGLVIDSLQIQDILDPTGYIKSLGAPRAAEVAMQARIAAAQRDREATEREQEAERLMQAAMRDTAVKASEYRATQEQAAATAAQAGPLAEAEAKQAVVEKETRIAQLEQEREQARLVAQVQRPAEAQAEALRVNAVAQRDARIAAAEAQAREVELSSVAAAKSTEVTGTANARAVQVTGEAEAAATRAKGLAEADAIAKRAEALAAQADAVIAQQVAEKVAERLPEIVQAAASAFSNIDNFTVLNGADGVTDTIAKIVGSAGPLMDIARSTLNRSTQGNGDERENGTSEDWRLPQSKLPR